MEFEKIKQLISDVSDSKLTSVDIELPDGTKLSMKKEALVVNTVSEVPTTSNIIQTVANNTDITTVQNELNSENENIVKSPMVGTFYSKPSPTSNPYVEIGKTIQKGDTLCIIEAMKLMNEIESEFAGKIVEILVNDGDVVEYGTPLFKIMAN